VTYKSIRFEPQVQCTNIMGWHNLVFATKSHMNTSFNLLNIIDCEPTATKGVWLQALLEFGNHKGGQNLPFPFQDLAHQLSSSMNNVLCLDITCLTIQTT
jgi:hypothetical protein